jgi:hypothetical protein
MQLTATAFDSIDEQEAAVTGLSYGAGESWVLASQPGFDLERELPAGTLGTPPPGRERVLDPVRIQVALPRYGWTDLAYSLSPNGHPGKATDTAEPQSRGPAECSIANGGEQVAKAKLGPRDDLYASSQGRPDDRHGDGYPLGVPKFSYVDGFFFLGGTRGNAVSYQEYPPRGEPGQSQNTCVFSTEGPIDVPKWNAAVISDDPYDVGGFELPVAREIRQGLTEYRSGYYQDGLPCADSELDPRCEQPVHEGWHTQNTDDERTAVHVIQGWTDDLFPAIEAFRQFKYLKGLDSRWPVEAELADIGHPRGRNKSSTWRRLNQRAFGFLEQQIPGAHDQETVVSSEPTLCDDDGESDGGGSDENEPSQRLTGPTPEKLSQGRLLIDYQPGVLPPESGSGDPDGANSDPVVRSQTNQGGNCVNSVAPDWPGRYTAVSQPLKDSSTYIGLGRVELPATAYEGDGAATVNARVWDVPPGKDPEDCERTREEVEENPPQEQEGCPLLMTRGTYRLSAFYEPKEFPTPDAESLEACLDAELEGLPDLEELSSEEGDELGCPEEEREEALDRASEISDCAESETGDTLDDVRGDLPGETSNLPDDLNETLDDLTANQLDSVEEGVEDELDRLSSAVEDCADDAVSDVVEGLPEGSADCIEEETDETLDEVESRLEDLSTEEVDEELDDLPEQIEEDLNDASESCLQKAEDEPADGDEDFEGPTLTIPLFGNHWRLEPGHRIRLDLMQVDFPFLLPSRFEDTFAFSDARLVLPTRESREGELTGELTGEEDEDEQDDQEGQEDQSDVDAPESSSGNEAPEVGPSPTLPGPGAPRSR